MRELPDVESTRPLGAWIHPEGERAEDNVPVPAEIGARLGSQ
jgi:hypothetical protein